MNYLHFGSNLYAVTLVLCTLA
uniref:Uncharacterized protein n=1 Tax=Anguilla anguilla TaxID=7936 RepID=A0A0E9UMJ8_ANGAN